MTTEQVSRWPYKAITTLSVIDQVIESQINDRACIRIIKSLPTALAQLALHWILEVAGGLHLNR